MAGLLVGGSVLTGVPVAHSVLIHLLPGLALFARRYCGAPTGVQQTALQIMHVLAPSRWPGSQGNVVRGGQPSGVVGSLVWLFVVPLLFYTAWQLVYFLVVQVLPRQASLSQISRRLESKSGMLNMQCFNPNISMAVTTHMDGAGLFASLHPAKWVRHQLQLPGTACSQEQQLLESFGAQGQHWATCGDVWYVLTHLCFTPCTSILLL